MWAGTCTTNPCVFTLYWKVQSCTSTPCLFAQSITVSLDNITASHSLLLSIACTRQTLCINPSCDLKLKLVFIQTLFEIWCKVLHSFCFWVISINQHVTTCLHLYLIFGLSQFSILRAIVNHLSNFYKWHNVKNSVLP